MDGIPFPAWLTWFAPGWVAALLLLSIVYRKKRGLPIFPSVPRYALYAERMASSTMASHCLIVIVTDRALTVTPFFPFNLMFLPEILGIELAVPVERVTLVCRPNRLFGTNVVVSDPAGGRVLRLRVRDPAGLVAAAESARAR